MWGYKNPVEKQTLDNTNKIDNVSINVTLRRLHATIFAVENQYVLLILSLCLWAYLSSMQCACAVLSLFACPSLQFFFPPRYLINGTIFEKEFIGNKMCAFSFSKKNLPGNCFSLKIIVRDMMEIVYIGLYVKYTLFLSDLNENWIFTTNFQKKKILKYQISWKSVQWEPSCSIQTDGQTWRSW